jgi:hypothetical protein
LRGLPNGDKASKRRYYINTNKYKSTLNRVVKIIPLSYYVSSLTTEGTEMNFMQFWKKFGDAEVIAICTKAGTKFAYFKHLAYQRKFPSVPLAKALIAASGERLDFVKCFEEDKALKAMKYKMPKELA